VVTNDDRLAARLRFLKDHAMDPNRRYWHPEVGYNYRMTNLQAALGCAQLERFEELTAKRERVVDLYRRVLGGTDLTINPTREWAKPVPWLVCALLAEGTTRTTRDTVMADLRASGLDSRPYFHLLCEMPPYCACRRVGAHDESLPVAADLSARGLNLPSVTWLTEAQASRALGALTRGVLRQC
jgi:perosamine synthetase